MVGLTPSAQGLAPLGASLSRCQMEVSRNYSIFPCLGRIIIHTLAQRSLAGLSPDSPTVICIEPCLASVPLRVSLPHLPTSASWGHLPNKPPAPNPCLRSASGGNSAKDTLKNKYLHQTTHSCSSAEKPLCHVLPNDALSHWETLLRGPSRCCTSGEQGHL